MLRFLFQRAAVLAARLILPLVFLLPLGAHAHESEFQLQVVAQDGQVLLTTPMRSNDAWCLLWNHSVAGFTVSDCFAIEQGVMVLKTSQQPDFAAGLGHMEGRGKLNSDGQGGYLITEINEPWSDNRLMLRVGSKEVNHRLLYQGQETSLSKWVAGQRVTLRLMRK